MHRTKNNKFAPIGALLILLLCAPGAWADVSVSVYATAPNSTTVEASAMAEGDPNPAGFALTKVD